MPVSWRPVLNQTTLGDSKLTIPSARMAASTLLLHNISHDDCCLQGQRSAAMVATITPRFGSPNVRKQCDHHQHARTLRGSGRQYFEHSGSRQGDLDRCHDGGVENVDESDVAPRSKPMIWQPRTKVRWTPD